MDSLYEAGPGFERANSHTQHQDLSRQLTFDNNVAGRSSIQPERKSFIGSNQAINPCDPEAKRSKKLRKVRKHPLGDGARMDKFRVHLKMEKQEFRNEYIEYNVEIPIRVAVRMEYLMGSTKVNLNDTGYLDKLYDALTHEEDTELKKKERARELREKQRVKKLVVEGEMPPPADLIHLYKHPVFRVNTMLKRLAQHDKLLNAVPKPETQITPCEPFAYDGNEFFKHLHKFGTTDYIPKEVRRAQRIKLKGKIERAKARLREKMERNREEHINTLYKKPSGVPATDSPGSSILDSLSETEETSSETDDEDSSDENLTEEQKKQIAAQRKRKEKIERAKRRKEEKEMQLLFQIRERELEQKRFERKQEEDEKRRKMEHELKKLRDEEDQKYRNQLMEKEEMRAGLDENLKALLKSLSLTEMMGGKQVKETDSQKYLRQHYQIPEKSNLEAFKPRKNVIMNTFDEETEDARDMFEYSKEVKQLFEREQRVCDEFLKQINRIPFQQQQNKNRY